MDSILATCTIEPNLIQSPPSNINQFIDTLLMLSDQNVSHISFSRTETSLPNSLEQASDQTGVQNSLEPDCKKLNTGSNYFQNINQESEFIILIKSGCFNLREIIFNNFFLNFKVHSVMDRVNLAKQVLVNAKLDSLEIEEEAAIVVVDLTVAGKVAMVIVVIVEEVVEIVEASAEVEGLIIAG